MKMKNLLKNRRNNRTNMCFREWLTIATHSTMTTAIDIKRFSRPKWVGGVKTPENLNLITMGALIAITHAKTAQDAFYLPCQYILGMTQEQVNKALAVDVVSFAGWCAAQMDFINDMFKQLHRDYTPEERQAGAENLRFGVFGLVDWFAVRMGIHDHEEVERMPWIRIYECMKIDMEREAYQRRLQKIYINKSKRK